MSNSDPDTTVRRFLDGDLPDEDVQEALHRIADDPEARSMLQFELRMTQELATSRSARPSEAFAKSTIERLEEDGTEASEVSFLDRIKTWWAAAERPVFTIPVRPAHALVTLLIAAAVVWGVLPFGGADSRPNGLSQAQDTSRLREADGTTASAQTVWARFVYTDDDANSVAVAGDFSQWEPIPLSPHSVNGKTVWAGVVPVPRGEHEYQFVINGEKWVTDPLAPVQEKDGFGAKNAVLRL